MAGIKQLASPDGWLGLSDLGWAVVIVGLALTFAAGWLAVRWQRHILLGTILQLAVLAATAGLTLYVAFTGGEAAPPASDPADPTSGEPAAQAIKPSDIRPFSWTKRLLITVGVVAGFVTSAYSVLWFAFASNTAIKLKKLFAGVDADPNLSDEDKLRQKVLITTHALRRLAPAQRSRLAAVDYTVQRFKMQSFKSTMEAVQKRDYIGALKSMQDVVDLPDEMKAVVSTLEQNAGMVEILKDIDMVVNSPHKILSVVARRTGGLASRVAFGSKIDKSKIGPDGKAVLNNLISSTVNGASIYPMADEEKADIHLNLANYPLETINYLIQGFKKAGRGNEEVGIAVAHLLRDLDHDLFERFIGNFKANMKVAGANTDMSGFMISLVGHMDRLKATAIATETVAVRIWPLATYSEDSKNSVEEALRFVRPSAPEPPETNP